MTEQELYLFQRMVSNAALLKSEINDIYRALNKLRSDSCPISIVAGGKDDCTRVDVALGQDHREPAIALLKDILAEKEKRFRELRICVDSKEKEAAV